MLTVGMAFASLAFATLYHPADAGVYLMPLLISFSVWLGLGVAGLAAIVSRRSPALAVIVSLSVLAIVLYRPFSYYQQVDASQDRRAETFGRDVLSAVPENAILFAKGDRAIFTLWYFHFALQEREDLRVIATELLHFDWYQEVLQHTYPDLAIPGPFPYPETIVPANPNRPVCQVEYTDRAEIECSSPQQ
jgi:hypothetical protein